MSTIDVKDAAGATQTVQAPNGNGQATAANSRPAVLPVQQVTDIGVAVDTALRASPLPVSISDAATATLQATANTALANILNELKDDAFVTETLWEDQAVTPSVFYRESRVRSQDDASLVVTITRLSDNTVVGSLPATAKIVGADTGRDVEYLRWRVKTGSSGTGYASQDWLVQTIITNLDGAGSTVGTFWYNITQSAALSAPAAADVEDPTGAMTTAFGNQSDTAASTDTGTFSLMAFIKRCLQNWTTFQAKMPSLGTAADAGSIPVAWSTEGKALTGALTETAPASDTASSGLNGRLQRIAQRLTSLIALFPSALIGGRFSIEPLGSAVVARQLAAAAGNASTALTTTCTRISLFARTCDIRFVIGNGAQTASATTSHFCGLGERLEFVIAASSSIGVIRDTAAGANGTLEVTELN